MNIQANEKLETTPVKKLLWQLALPTVLAQLVNLLYNIVDRMYVGRIEGVGSLALAGLGVAFPILMLIAAFASMIGIGGGARAALAMGKHDFQTAEKLMGNAATLLVGLSAVLSVAFYFGKDAILMAFGASANTLPYASEYLGIYLLGTVFVMIALGLNMFITNQGFTKISMLSVLIGCLLNIVLDPLFIFALGMGVRGAAVATVISQGASALFVIAFLSSKRSLLKWHPRYFIPDRRIVGLILSLGISTFVMQATECLVQLVFNTGMRQYGGDAYVALMAIFFSVMQMLMMPQSGFGQGAQPIIGYNYGAGRYDRVKETFRLLIGISLGFSLAAVGLVMLFPQVAIGAFTESPDLIAMGIRPLRVYLIGMAIFGIQNACQQTFVALGQAKVSMFIASLRKLILLIPLALILPRIGNLGVWGLFLAEPISDVISVVTTAVLFQTRRKKLGLA